MTLHCNCSCDCLLQVDRASAMVEKLCTPSDDEHNEHKRLQLRELAALNGTLKDITACFVCGDEGHDAEHCPKKVRFCMQRCA
jgi:splicing factor 1